MPPPGSLTRLALSRIKGAAPGHAGVAVEVKGTHIGDPPPDSDPISPVGFQRVEEGDLVVIGSISRSRPGADALLSELHELAGGHSVRFVGDRRPASLPEAVTFERREQAPKLIASLRRAWGVFLHPALHSRPSEEAALILNLARAGVPMWGTVSDAVQEFIPSKLVRHIDGASLDDVTDPDARERLSVHLRRSAWAGEYPTPQVSVVVATNRPDFVDHALAQLERLDYPNLQVVLAAHGFSIDQGDTVAGVDDVVEVPPAAPFGDALSEGFARATGDLIAKMDDDDWYAPEHVSDLVCAMHYSGAPLVAKGAEFVYLAQLDITIRRMASGSETYGNRNVAGGTFLMRRELYDDIGGWRSLSRHVDQALLDDVERNGQTWYRTHGYGYILHRRRHGHTWDAAVDYFLDSSTSQARGLDLAGALVLGAGA